MLTVYEAVQHLKALTLAAAHNGLLLQMLLVGGASSGKTTVLQMVHSQSTHTEMVSCAMYYNVQDLVTQVVSSTSTRVLLIDDACVFDINKLLLMMQSTKISFIAASRHQVDERYDCIILETPRSINTNVTKNVISFCSPVSPYCGHMTRVQCILLCILHICMYSSPSQDDYRFGRTTLKRKGQSFRQNSKQILNGYRQRASRVSVTRLKTCFQAYSSLQPDMSLCAYDIDDAIASLINSRCIICTKGATQSKTYLQSILTEGELANIRTRTDISQSLME